MEIRDRYRQKLPEDKMSSAPFITRSSAATKYTLNKCFLCMYMYLCVYVCIYRYVYVCVYGLCVYVCMYVQVCAYLCADMCVSVGVWML